MSSKAFAHEIHSASVLAGRPVFFITSAPVIANTCTQVPVQTKTISAGSGNKITYTADAINSTDGIGFDLLNLDNSYNATINGVLLSTEELQYDPTRGANKVVFDNNLSYSQGSVRAVWNITGTVANPLVRVHIYPDGTVLFFGSKRAGGLLFPMHPTKTLNGFPWHMSGINTIVISQEIVGPTLISGNGYGLITLNSDAGANIANACAGSSTILTGTPNTGLWTIQSTPANPALSAITSTAAGVTTVNFPANAAGDYNYVYTVGGVCQDVIKVSVIPKPNAGLDQTVCALAGAILTGTSPATGLWSVAAANPAGGTTSTTISGIAPINFGNNASGIYKFIYAANDCADTTSVTVIPTRTPFFPEIGPICAGATLSELPTTSTNSITGTWSPALNNTATTTYTFTPNNVQCATSATMTITINPSTDAACTINPCAVGDNNGFEMPLIASNTIQTKARTLVGGWGIMPDNAFEIWSNGNRYGVPAYEGKQFIEIDAQQLNTVYKTFTATAGQQLQLAFAHRGRNGKDVMRVTVSTSLTGPFTVLGTYSDGKTTWGHYSVNYTIPASGTYYVNFKAVSSTGGPALGNFLDAVNIELPQAPVFSDFATSVPTTFCVGDIAPALPVISENGVTGTWSPTSISTTASGNTSYTFTPGAGQCASPSTIIVTVNPLPFYEKLTSSCAGGTLNSIIVNATVSAGVLEYNVDGGTYQASNTFTGLTSGVHTFNMRVQGTLCEVSSGAQNINCSCPVVTGNSISADQTICGSVVPEKLTGTDAIISPAIPFTYQWQSSTDGINWMDIAGETEKDFGFLAPLAQTTYYRRLVQVNGCPDAASPKINITKAASVIPLFAQVLPVCIGSTLAALPITSSNGISGSWSPSLNNTATTTYTFTPTTGQCANTATMSIIVNPLPVYADLAVNCSGGTLNSVIVNATVSAGVLEYSMDGGAYQPSNTFTGLASAMHAFNMRVQGTLCEISSGTQNINCSCPVVNNNNISANQPLCGNVVPTKLTGTDASISPATSFIYQWQVSNDGNNWTDIEGEMQKDLVFSAPLANNFYYRRLVKLTSCPDAVSNMVSITINPLPVYTDLTVNCTASTLNSVSVNGTISNGGVLEYNADGGAYQTSNTFNGLATGMHTFNIRLQGSLCQVSSGPQNVNCSCPVVSNNTIGTDQTICLGSTPAILNGSVPASAPTAAANFQWQLSTDQTNWSDIAGATAQSFTAAALHQTTYYRRLIKIPGCTDAASNTATITVSQNITPAFSFPTSYCQNTTAIALPAVSDNGIKGSWNPTVISTTTTGKINYKFTPDAGQCSIATASVMITINITDTPVFSIETNYCQNQLPFNLPTVSDNGISGTWTPAVVAATTGIAVYNFTPSAGNCSLDPIRTTITVSGPPPAFSLGHDTSICEGETIVLRPNIDLIGSYRWQNGETNKNLVAKNNGVYSLSIDNGCGITNGSIKVSVLSTCQLLMPNAFTPNNDGNNDIFRVKHPFPVKQFVLVVYNRWGERIFYTNDIYSGWDGRYKGIVQPTGGYVWQLNLTDKKDAKLALKGSVILIR